MSCLEHLLPVKVDFRCNIDRGGYRNATVSYKTLSEINKIFLIAHGLAADEP